MLKLLNRKKGFLICILHFLFHNIFLPSEKNVGLAFAQQLPYYTQFKSNNIMLNPGVTGTKKLIDARLNYRNQWVGFESAPVTETFSINSRFAKGVMGLGAMIFSDKTGPTSRTNISLSYAYHVWFDDVELSLGIAGNRITYQVDPSLITLHIPIDPSIDKSVQMESTVYDASAGAYFYNDRFHLGLSILNLREATINFFPKDDLLHKTQIQMVPHIYGSMGYNWSGQPEWIWENSLQIMYVKANPMNIDYNLRLHYKQKVFGGFSFRFHDAFALHTGVSFKENFQLGYSYDLVISPLRSFQSGSHEIMIIWSSNLGQDKKGKYMNKEFKRQKYNNMF
ncbi:MAG: type IX secretion system membrane protein PorP/SprF [Bacteroidota bacterium]